MCYADASNDRRIAQDDWCASKVVEESNSRTEQECHDIHMDLVEQASVQQLLNSASAVDSHGLPSGSGFGLLHSTLDAIGHEVDSRVRSRPSCGNAVGQHECRTPGVISAPAIGSLKCALALIPSSFSKGVLKILQEYTLPKQSRILIPKGIKSHLPRSAGLPRIVIFVL